MDKLDLLKSKVFCSSKDSENGNIKAGYKLKDSTISMCVGQRAFVWMNTFLNFSSLVVDVKLPVL